MNLLALQSNVSTEKGIWYRLHALHRMLPITSCNWAFSFTGAHAMHVFSLLGSCRSQIHHSERSGKVCKWDIHIYTYAIDLAYTSLLSYS